MTITGSQRAILTLSTIILLLFTLTVTLSPVAYASDDANNGNLNLSGSTTTRPSDNSATANSTTTSDTIRTLDQVSQGVNSTQYQLLVQQLKDQLQSKNQQGADQTLNNLKQLVNTTPSQDVTPTARDLVQSLQVHDNQLSVDPGKLSSLIGSPDNNGVPTGLQGMDPKLAAQDLLSLSNLLRNIDPNTSNNFSTDAYNIQDSILHGLLGGNGSTNSGFPRIGFGALNPPSLNSGVEPFSPLSTSLNTSTPNIPLSVSIFIILIIIASIVGVILVRSRRFTLPRRISLLTRRLRPLNQDQPDKYRLNNAKDMIIYYFRKTTRIMGQRGVSKQHYETHREFSIKCVSRPESTPVGHVSGLYEKAMFSGREVTLQDAADAGNNVTIIETIPYNPAKNNSPL